MGHYCDPNFPLLIWLHKYIYIKLITGGAISHIQFILIYIQPLSLLSEMNLRGLEGAMTHSLYNQKTKKKKKKKVVKKKDFYHI
jgi:hypothetical protein